MKHDSEPDVVLHIGRRTLPKIDNHFSSWIGSRKHAVGIAVHFRMVGDPVFYPMLSFCSDHSLPAAKYTVHTVSRRANGQLGKAAR